MKRTRKIERKRSKEHACACDTSPNYLFACTCQKRTARESFPARKRERTGIAGSGYSGSASWTAHQIRRSEIQQTAGTGFVPGIEGSNRLLEAYHKARIFSKKLA